MHRKGKTFEWTEECATIFEKLKKITNASVLKIADLDKEFVVCKYACKRRLSGVMMWDGQVVCYVSRKLNEHEKNYVTHDLELEAIIHPLKTWRHYLLGRRFILLSDQSGLRYLFDQRNMNSRKIRWLDTLSEFDFKVRYIKAKENRVADALSRRVQVNHIATMSSYGTYL